jgi:phage terminase large subunit GpA-like protein
MDGGVLVLESVRYVCPKCGGEHHEHDKTALFDPANGAEWVPTAKPVEPGIRSYHLPAFYSPVGFQPWYKCVSAYLKGFDPVERKVRDIGKYQVFYNNILAEPFEIMGTRIRFTAVSAHRRSVYRLGQIPNEYAKQWSGSPVLFLTCQVDVHKKNLAVSVMGWTRDARCYVIDYWRFEVEGEDDDCSELSSPVWGKLRALIEEQAYVADDGRKYRLAMTLIDAGYANDTVTTFCSDYETGVYPILGRDRPGKNQTIKEFAEFKTQSGTVGYRILVDHYKDRMGPVLRREWAEGAGEQKPHHFNAPVDVTDKQLKELTVETRREKKDDRGNTTYEWYRPGNARNELFDLLGYGYAAVEIIAWGICIQHFGGDTVDWDRFWAYAEAAENADIFGRVA